MRLKYLLACSAIAAVSGGAAIVGCYAPGELGDTPYRCYADHPECPDGYECQLTGSPNPKNMNKCVRMGGGTMLNFVLPGQTMVYMGMMSMSGLTSQNCPAMYDADLETGGGNNTIGTASGNHDDGQPHGLMPGYAICPAGDFDVYSINVAATEYFRVKVTYDIKFGDLDLAIYDAEGKLAVLGGASLFDNDATKSDACVVSTATPGATAQVFYAVVYGANNSKNATDQNSYSIKIDKSNTKTNFTCAGGGPPDMGMGDGPGPDLR